MKCEFCDNEIPMETIIDIGTGSDSLLEYGLVLWQENRMMHKLCIDKLIETFLKTHKPAPKFALYTCADGNGEWTGCGYSFDVPDGEEINENTPCPNCGMLDSWL